MVAKRYVLGVDHKAYEFACINEETGDIEILFGGVIEKPGEPLIIDCYLGLGDRLGVQGCPHTREIIPTVLFCPRCCIDPTDCLRNDHEKNTVTL